MIISLFLKSWEIWIINLKFQKFSCILGKYNTLQQKLEALPLIYIYIYNNNNNRWSWEKLKLEFQIIVSILHYVS